MGEGSVEKRLRRRKGDTCSSFEFNFCFRACSLCFVQMQSHHTPPPRMWHPLEPKLRRVTLLNHTTLRKWELAQVGTYIPLGKAKPSPTLRDPTLPSIFSTSNHKKQIFFSSVAFPTVDVARYCLGWLAHHRRSMGGAIGRPVLVDLTNSPSVIHTSHLSPLVL